jgi:hypothetical protein
MITKELSKAWRLWQVIGIILLAVMLAVPAQATSYKFTLINYPASSLSIPVAVSPNGAFVLGDASQSTGLTDPNRFIYNTKTHIYTPLKITIHSAIVVSAKGVNSSGAVVGSYTDGSGMHGFLYYMGGVRDIDYPGALSTDAVAINDYWTVVGSYIDGAHVEHSFKKLYAGGYSTFDFPITKNCFGNTPARYVFAAAINNNGLILGTSGRICEFGGISILDNHGAFSIVSKNLEVFDAMNAQGLIVGTAYGGIPSGSLVVDQNGVITQPNPNGLGGFNFGEGVDSNGNIVGSYSAGLTKGIPSSGGFLATPIP